MILSWLRSRRRKKILSSPFSEKWTDYLIRNVYHYRQLTESQQAKVRRDTQVFVGDKNWEGCNGLEVTDEVKVTIAGQIAILVLGFDEQFFDTVESILVYPNAYVAKNTTISRAGVVLVGDSLREGEAWPGGPVILSWSDALANGQGLGAHNLVIHEFAHQLDMLNGRSADGIPPMRSRESEDRWTEVCEREYEKLCHDCEHGHHTVFDSYGTTNAAEFFAVVTETFFEKPIPFYHHHQQMFDLFRDYFRIDPLRFAHVKHGLRHHHQKDKKR